MDNNAEECDECHHHPWKHYIERNSDWYSRAVHECKCKCHSIPKNKKLIKFNIERSDDLWRSSDFRLERSITKQGYKIVTKRQWEEFKKRHSWTGKWKNYKRIRDESRAFEEAKRQGVIGYREDIPLLNANRSNDGHWGKMITSLLVFLMAKFSASLGVTGAAAHKSGLAISCTLKNL